MGQHGTAWVSTREHGAAWDRMGRSWEGRSWESMGEHGRAWDCMRQSREGHGKVMGEHGRAWKSMGQSWGSMGESVGQHGRERGSAWDSMGQHMTAWEGHGKVMGEHGRAWTVTCTTASQARPCVVFCVCHSNSRHRIMWRASMKNSPRDAHERSTRLGGVQTG